MTAKRRRTKEEVAQEKMFRSNTDQAMHAKEDEIADLKRALSEYNNNNPEVINRVDFV